MPWCCEGFFLGGRFGTCPYRIISFGTMMYVGADSKSTFAKIGINDGKKEHEN
jgi:hypothetical protein